MEIQQIVRPAKLINLDADILAFDLEMANSFRNARPVICMIGTERYEPDQEQCVTTLATITRRKEEPQLIGWFLDHLKAFSDRHGAPKLATFSGKDNDIPWVQERIERHGLPEQQAEILKVIEHLDLKEEFRKRTQSDKISLKKLEELFGIDRESTTSSRKVSQVLTDVLSPHKDRDEIPGRIYDYLMEDVHHLLLILDRWDGYSLESHHYTELEYLEQNLSLLRQCHRLEQQTPSRLPSSQLKALRQFARQLGESINKAITQESFEDFRLPPAPEVSGRSSDMERFKRKYQQLSSVQLWEDGPGSYRLKRDLQRPKGAVAVVRRNGRVLMIRRAEHIERAPGYWGLPGGVLETGESPGDGAVRELKEELNLEGKALRLLGTSTSLNKLYELFWVDVQVADYSGLTPSSEEVAEAKWVTPREFKELEPLIPGAEEGFRRFLGSFWAGTKDR